MATIDPQAQQEQQEPDFTDQAPLSTMQFGCIMIEFYQYSQHAYRIVWRSKMTGATTSFISDAQANYQIIRKWATNKKLPDLNASFDKRTVAFTHFLKNVDIIKIAHDILRRARDFCTQLFAVQEDLPDLKGPDFRFGRLQSAIGQQVNIYSKTSKDHLIAKGHLLQLVGGQVQVYVSKRLDLQNMAKIQKFSSRCVYLI